jgi:hypothetical protein
VLHVYLLLGYVREIGVLKKQKEFSKAMRTKQLFPALLALLALILVLSACGSTASSQTAGQTILNSATAMKKLKTVHLDMSMNESVSLTGQSSSSSSSSTPSSIAITANGHGDEVLPDQSAFNLTVGGIGNYTFAEITQGQTLYIQNQHGQWYKIDKSKFVNSSSGSTLSGLNVPDFNQLLQLAQKDAKVTDHGDQTLNGVSLRHITVTLDKNGFAQLLQNSGLLNGLSGANQQKIDSFLNSGMTLNATLDFWIDEATSYLHRFTMQFTLALDLGKFLTPTPGTTGTTPTGASVQLNMTVDLSKFNDTSIKIIAPSGAIPTDDPTVIFSGQ